jgi:FkbM family methyltransferase
MLSAERYGMTVSFPDIPGGTALPYTYRPFAEGRWYEQPLLEHIRRQDRVGVYVDVGAHMGTHTAWFATHCPSTHVHAVEPVSRFADQLARVINANHLTQKVTVHRVGVADRPGTASNMLSPEHQVGFHDAGAATATVENFAVTTLDDLVDGPVAVIKLDIEGMEAKALQGAGRILAKHQPLVYAEALSDAAFEEIRAVLADHGYAATGRVFNASPTHEFAPSTRVLRAVAPIRRVGLIGRRHLGAVARKLSARA